MDMKLKVAEYIAQAAQQSFENCALTGNDVSAMIETPPDKKMGDYALPCFRLSKTMRCAPQMIAGKLAEKIACEEIDHVEVVGGYLNVFLRRGGLARDIVEAVLKIRGVGVPAKSAEARRCAWIIPPSTLPSVSTSAICPRR